MKPKLISTILVACFAAAACRKATINNNTEEPTLSISGQKAAETTFDPGNFSNSTMLTNKYLPYQPGTKYVFEGQTADGLERNEIQRIDAVKEVMGINVAVIRDRVWLNGILEEDTRDWFAQDNDGNVWYMGEDVDNYNPDGTIRDHEGAWEAGINGAIPGVIMLADPRPGDSYQQEFAEGIAEDEAKVVTLGLTIQVPFDTFSDCLKIKEWSNLENGAIDFKFYAPGIGLILEKTQNETLELIAIE